MTCKWIVREGTHNTYWAFTPCKRGFNYLSKVHKLEDIQKAYNGRTCPICHKTIAISTELLNDTMEEI